MNKPVEEKKKEGGYELLKKHNLIGRISEEPKKKVKRKSSRISQKKIEKIVQDEFRKSLNKLKVMEKKFDRMIRKHDAKMYHFDKLRGVVTAQMQRYLDKMSSVEETFFILYHNIKKNQFLYATGEDIGGSEYKNGKLKGAK